MDIDVYLAVLELLEIRGGMPDSEKLYFPLVTHAEHVLTMLLGKADKPLLRKDWYRASGSGGTRMKANVAPRYKTHVVEEKYCYCSWLDDCVERLEGKEAYTEFQERYYGMPEYYALVESLMA
jgi:hypothetical protein